MICRHENMNDWTFTPEVGGSVLGMTLCLWTRHFLHLTITLRYVTVGILKIAKKSYEVFGNL